MSSYNQCDGLCDEGTCDLCDEPNRIATYSVKLYVHEYDTGARCCIIKRYSAEHIVQIVGVGISEPRSGAVRAALDNLRSGGTGCCNNV